MTAAQLHPIPPITPDRTNLSGSRGLDGVSENAAAIPVVGPGVKGRSDSGGEVVDPSSIAPPARTSRRGFLMNTIVSAASVATATALVPSQSIADLSAPTSKLLRIDQAADDDRVQMLWNERTAATRRLRRTWADTTAAEASMPEWAQSGPMYLLSDGSYGGTVVGWPRIEGGRLPVGQAMINKRPGPHDLEKNFNLAVRQGGQRSRKMAQRTYDRALAALNDRRARQRAERDKVGLTELNATLDNLADLISELNEQIEAIPGVSPTKTAAVFMIAITRGFGDNALDDSDAQETMAQAILPLIRPHLSGLIAQHIDDVIQHPSTPHGERDFW